MGKVRMALGAVLLFALPVAGGAQTEDSAMTRITVTVDGVALAATLDDTPAGRDFASLLPLDLTLSDYHATEKVPDLPRALDTTGAPARYAAQTGDITLYAPCGNLAIFYKPFPATAGLVRLGAFDEPIDALLKDGEFRVQIERAE